MQTISEDGGDALRQVEAERGIGRALAAQAHGVEDDRMNVIEGVRVEVPAVRGEQPGPAEDVTGVQRVDGQHARGPAS